MSEISNFYKQNLERFSHLGEIPDTEYFKAILDRPKKGIKALRELSGGNEELRFAMLQVFMLLPKMREIEQTEKKVSREDRNEKRDFQRFIERITADSIDYIKKVKCLNPDVDENKLIKKELAWVYSRAATKRGVVERHEQAPSFNELLGLIYEKSKAETGLKPGAVHERIATLLNAFGMKNTHGNKFTRQGVSKLIK